MASSTARQPLAAGNWGPPAPVAPPPTSWGSPQVDIAVDGEDCNDELAPMSAGEFLGAIGTIILSVPAIIGAWCWPMVVGALLSLGPQVMNAGSGSGVVDFFHGFQVALMMTVMLNLVQFTWWRCKQSRVGTCWQVHKPTFCVLLAAIMVNIQPMLILIIGSWKLCCAACPVKDCTPSGLTYPPWPLNPNGYRECHSGGNVFWSEEYCDGKHYSTFPNQPSGWAIQVICTWGGFLFMFIGVMQATQLHVKLANKWRMIRTGRRAS